MSAARHVTNLEKRAAHLRRRIDALPEQNRPYDRAELGALEWAIRHLRAAFAADLGSLAVQGRRLTVAIKAAQPTLPPRHCSSGRCGEIVGGPAEAEGAEG